MEPVNQAAPYDKDWTCLIDGYLVFLFFVSFSLVDRARKSTALKGGPL